MSTHRYRDHGTADRPGLPDGCEREAAAAARRRQEEALPPQVDEEMANGVIEELWVVGGALAVYTAGLRQLAYAPFRTSRHYLGQLMLLPHLFGCSEKVELQEMIVPGQRSGPQYELTIRSATTQNPG